MRTGENDRDLTKLEKAAGKKAASNIRRTLRGMLLNIKDTGTMLRALSASAVMKYDALDSITIKASRVTFIQHHGFEGIKSNGAKMSLKPYDHFNILFQKTKAVEVLADEIGSIRAEEITSKIRL